MGDSLDSTGFHFDSILIRLHLFESTAIKNVLEQWKEGFYSEQQSRYHLQNLLIQLVQEMHLLEQSFMGAGLANLGNTWFLNSILQCLTYTEPLAAYLQSGKHQTSCRTAGFCALCAIQKHVSRALQSTGRILAPKEIVSNLRELSHPGFRWCANFRAGVPIFGLNNRTPAYRFVTLVDAFDLCVDNELGFAKDRTISRLTEMNSTEYLEQHAELLAAKWLPEGRRRQ